MDPRRVEDGRSGARGGGSRGPRVRAFSIGMTVSAELGAATGEAGRAGLRRVLLKLSGEALMGERAFGIDQERVESLAREIVSVQEEGLEIALVIGAGNFVRGMEAAAAGMDRATADYAGMLATVLNSLSVQDALERHGAQTRVLSAITVAEVAEPYIRRRAIRHLEQGRIVIFAAGTGNPVFTTDTAASLRAAEIGADIVLKATKVDGVYDRDPMKHPGAKRYTEISYNQALAERMEVMDATSIVLCRDQNLPVRVFNM